jgi:hypothetical protein
VSGCRARQGTQEHNGSVSYLTHSRIGACFGNIGVGLDGRIRRNIVNPVVRPGQSPLDLDRREQGEEDTTPYSGLARKVRQNVGGQCISQDIRVEGNANTHSDQAALMSRGNDGPSAH